MLPQSIMRKKNIAFVPQNAFILNDTILNNVTFGDKSITESDVFNALDIVNLKNTVRLLSILKAKSYICGKGKRNLYWGCKGGAAYETGKTIFVFDPE